jgi:26S proteasome regulatory subunit N1
VNAGFGNDKLLTNVEETANWIYKNKDHGMLGAAASLGCIHLWDVENGLTHIDKYTYSEEDNVKAGALMAIGLASSNVKHESDPALAILSEYVNCDKAKLRAGSIFGYVYRL